MKKLFSLVYVTNRPGGFDLLVESLKWQPPYYELIVVDGLEDRAARLTVPEYMLSNGIPLRAYTTPCLPPGGCNKSGIARAYNTGAVWTTTDNVVLIHDLTWVYPGWVSEWNQILGGCQANSMICGTASLRNAYKPIENGDITLWPTGVSCWWYVWSELEVWTPEYFETFHTFLPISFFEITNGLDERNGAESMGEALFAQTQWWGYQLHVEKKVRIGMINHKPWGGIWDTRYGRKEKPEPEIELHPVSPNPYCFKDIRDDLLSKPWTGNIGL